MRVKIQEKEYRRICLAFIEPSGKGDWEEGIDRAEEFIRLCTKRYSKLVHPSLEKMNNAEAVQDITGIYRQGEAAEFFQAFLTAAPGALKYLGEGWKTGDDIFKEAVRILKPVYAEWKQSPAFATWNEERKNSKKVP